MNRYRTTLFCVFLLLAAGPSAGEDPAQHDGKLLSGMSIVGNDEAPKSLVIVPWKSSELGDALDVSRGLDDGLQPVDRQVFRRQLDYYAIRVNSTANHVSGEQ